MNQLVKVYQVLVAVGFALPAFAMSARLFRVWRTPMEVDEGRWVNLGVGLFAGELVLLQAGTIIGALVASGNVTNFAVVGYLTVFYGYIIWVVARSWRNTMLVWSVLWLVLGRGLAVLLGTSQDDALLLIAHSIVGGAIYLLMVLVSVIVPLPHLGITPETVARLRLHGDSVWRDQPEQAIGAAAIYFLLLGIAQTAVLSWVDVHAIFSR